jgi:hypothetical protein
MKSILTTLFFLFSISSFSQKEGEVISYKDGWQKGQHIFVDGDWKPHGKWKHNYGKALYDKGKLVWIKIHNDRKWTGDEIKIVQLERKIKQLKQELVTTTN